MRAGRFTPGYNYVQVKTTRNLAGLSSCFCNLRETEGKLVVNNVACYEHLIPMDIITQDHGGKVCASTECGCNTTVLQKKYYFWDTGRPHFQSCISMEKSWQEQAGHCSIINLKKSWMVAVVVVVVVVGRGPLGGRFPCIPPLK
jgi:hypothetical protein